MPFTTSMLAAVVIATTVSASSAIISERQVEGEGVEIYHIPFVHWTLTPNATNVSDGNASIPTLSFIAAKSDTNGLVFPDAAFAFACTTGGVEVGALLANQNAGQSTYPVKCTQRNDNTTTITNPVVSITVEGDRGDLSAFSVFFNETTDMNRLHRTSVWRQGDITSKDWFRCSKGADGVKQCDTDRSIPQTQASHVCPSASGDGPQFTC